MARSSTRKIPRTVELANLVADLLKPFLEAHGFALNRSRILRFQRHHEDHIDTICISATRYYGVGIHFGVYHTTLENGVGKVNNLYTLAEYSVNYGPKGVGQTGGRYKFRYEAHDWVFTEYPFQFQRYANQILFFAKTIILPWLEKHSDLRVVRKRLKRGDGWFGMRDKEELLKAIDTILKKKGR
jgi:hypothetical protein